MRSGKSPLSSKLKFVFAWYPMFLFFSSIYFNFFLWFFSSSFFSYSTCSSNVLSSDFFVPYFYSRCGLSKRKSSKIFSWILFFAKCIFFECWIAWRQYLENTYKSKSYSLGIFLSLFWTLSRLSLSILSWTSFIVSPSTPKLLANLNFTISSVFNLRRTPIIWYNLCFYLLIGFFMLSYP